MNVIATIKHTPSGNGYHVEHGTQKEYFDSYAKARNLGNELLKEGLVVEVINKVFPEHSQKIPV